MIRILIAIVVGAISGVGLGKMQTQISNSGFEERFEGTFDGDQNPVDATLEEEVYTNSRVKVLGGDTYNFGTMRHGETLDHTFVFRNVGTDPLSLTMGESSCTCTVGELDNSTLQPGEQTDVKLTWTAKSVIADYAQTATIHTNDPTNSEVQLKVLGKIAQSFVVEPSSLQLGDVSVNEPLTQTFHVFSYIDNSKTMEHWEWSNPETKHLVDIKVVEKEISEEEYPKHKFADAAHEVTVAFKAGLPIGPLNSRVLFGGGVEDEDEKSDIPTLDVPVVGKVVGDITMFGGSSFDPDINSVDFGTISSEDGARVTVWLAAHGANRDQVQPEIISVRPENVLDVKIGEAKDRGKRRVFPITIEVPKGAPEVYYPGSSSKSFGKVRIRTNLKDGHEVSLFFKLVVKK